MSELSAGKLHSMPHVVAQKQLTLPHPPSNQWSRDCNDPPILRLRPIEHVG